MLSPVWAQGRYWRENYGPGVQPLDRILPMVRNGRPGRFYDAEGPFPDAIGGYHYRIKWLTPDGRVIWLVTDARSGRVLGVARGDWRERGPEPVMPYFRGIPFGPPSRYLPGGNRFGLPGGGPYGGPAVPPAAEVWAMAGVATAVVGPAAEGDVGCGYCWWKTIPICSGC